MGRPIYDVSVRREGEWLALLVDVGHREVATQARTGAEADGMVREAVAMALDVDPDSFDLEWYDLEALGIGGDETLAGEPLRDVDWGDN